MQAILNFLGFDKTDAAPIVDEMIKPGTITIFSKVWCSYCRNSREILSKVVPPEKLNVVELTTHRHGSAIQAELAKRTGQTTVPSIWFGTKHVGGNSDLEELYYGKRTLLEELRSAGVDVK